MDTFQFIVIIVAVILLVIMLIFIGVSLHNKKSKAVFPPVVAECPDYWLDMSEGNAKNCVNAKNLGSCDIKSMDFSGAFWSGSDGLCHKSKWAKQCNLTWDGVTNSSKSCQ
jgi:hypothetical protein